VTGLQSCGFHASNMTDHPGAQHRGAWQSPWDQVAVPTAPRRRGSRRSVTPQLRIHPNAHRAPGGDVHRFIWLRVRLPRNCGHGLMQLVA
jgi:hypothetical protein